MNEDKINWCCKQKRGIKIIGLKPHLSDSYIEEAEKDLKEISSTGKKWKIIIAYYSCYEALYSLLMKCGIKSEIHDCSIELMSLFEFKEEDIDYIKDLKKARENTQYYLKKDELKHEDKVKEFIFKCKEILNNLNSNKLEEIRNKIKDASD